MSGFQTEEKFLQLLVQGQGAEVEGIVREVLSDLKVEERVRLLGRILTKVAVGEGNVLQRVRLLEGFEGVLSSKWPEIVGGVSLFEVRSVLKRFEVWLRITCDQILLLRKRQGVDERCGLQLLQRLCRVTGNCNKKNVIPRVKGDWITFELAEGFQISQLFPHLKGTDEAMSAALDQLEGCLREGRSPDQNGNELSHVTQCRALLKSLERSVKNGRGKDEVGIWIRGIVDLLKSSRVSGGNLTDEAFVVAIRQSTVNTLKKRSWPLDLCNALIWTVIEAIPEFKDDRKVTDIVPILHSLLVRMKEGTQLNVEFQSWRTHLKTYLGNEEFCELASVLPPCDNFCEKSGFEKFYSVKQRNEREIVKVEQETNFQGRFPFSRPPTADSELHEHDFQQGQEKRCRTNSVTSTRSSVSGAGAEILKALSLKPIFSSATSLTTRRDLDAISVKSTTSSLVKSKSTDSDTIYKEKIRVQQGGLFFGIQNGATPSVQGKYIREIKSIFKDSADNSQTHNDLEIIQGLMESSSKYCEKAQDEGRVVTFWRAMVWVLLELFPILKQKDQTTLDNFASSFVDAVRRVCLLEEMAPTEREHCTPWLTLSESFLSKNEHQCVKELLGPYIPPFCSKTCFDNFYPLVQPSASSTAASRVDSTNTPFPPKKDNSLLGATALEFKKEISFTSSVLDLDDSIKIGVSAKSFIPPTYQLEFTKHIKEEQESLLTAILQGLGKSSQRKCITESWKLFKESTKSANHNDFAVIQSGVLAKFPNHCKEAGDQGSIEFRKATIWTLLGFLPHLKRKDLSLSKLSSKICYIVLAGLLPTSSPLDMAEYYSWIGIVEEQFGSESAANLKANLPYFGGEVPFKSFQDIYQTSEIILEETAVPTTPRPQNDVDYKQLISLQKDKLLDNVVKNLGRPAQRRCIEEIWELFKTSVKTSSHKDGQMMKQLVEASLEKKYANVAKLVGDEASYIFRKGLAWTLIGLFPYLKNVEQSRENLSRNLGIILPSLFRQSPSLKENFECRAWIEAARPYLNKDDLFTIEKMAPTYLERIPGLKSFEDFYPLTECLEDEISQLTSDSESPVHSANRMSGRGTESYCSNNDVTSVNRKASSSSFANLDFFNHSIPNPQLVITQEKPVEPCSSKSQDKKDKPSDAEKNATLPGSSQAKSPQPPEEKKEKEGILWNFAGFTINKKSSPSVKPKPETSKSPESETDQVATSVVENNNTKVNQSQTVASIVVTPEETVSVSANPNSKSSAFYMDWFSSARTKLVETIKLGKSKEQEGAHIREMLQAFRESITYSSQHKDTGFISLSFFKLNEISESNFGHLDRDAKSRACLAFRKALIWTLIGFYPLLKFASSHAFLGKSILDLMKPIVSFNTESEIVEYLSWIDYLQPNVSEQALTDLMKKVDLPSSSPILTKKRPKFDDVYGL